MTATHNINTIKSQVNRHRRNFQGIKSQYIMYKPEYRKCGMY